VSTKERIDRALLIIDELELQLEVLRKELRIILTTREEKEDAKEVDKGSD